MSSLTGQNRKNVFSFTNPKFCADQRTVLRVIRRFVLCLSALLLFVAQPSVRGKDTDSAESLIEEELNWLRAEAFISIATGFAQPLHQAPAIATVITAADIEAMGITELDEALETVPGLHVARNGFQGYGPIYTIRGIYSDFNPEVLLLINGIPVTASLTGGRGPLWGGLPVNNIARIEVIRGPGSALYGADAFAGVINVVTKTSGDIAGTEAGARAGRFDTQEYWALHGGKWGDFDVALALEYFTTDGQREQIDADFQTALDGLFGGPPFNFKDPPASLAPGPVNLRLERLDARADISLGVWALRLGYQGRRNVETGVGGAQALDPDAQLEYDRFNADLTYHDPQFTDHWDVTVQASFLDTGWETETKLTLFPPGSRSGNPPFPVLPEGFIGKTGTTEHHVRFNLSGIYSGYDSHVIHIGAGVHHADLREVTDIRNIDLTTGLPLQRGQRIDYSDTPFAFQPEDNRTNLHAFLQDTWAFTEILELTTGLRYDHYSDFGSTVNPRLALVSQVLPQLTTKLLYGRAFRAPSFLELYSVNNPNTLGNRDLDPEIIDTVELAFDYQATDDVHLALNLFHYWIDDKVQFVPDPTTPSPTDLRAQNVGEQTGLGFELETRWKVFRNIDILANYAYQNSTDEETGKDAGNAPHHQLFLRADWYFLPSWQLNARVNFVADRDRVAGDPRPEIDDYTTVDLTLRHKGLADHWDFAAGIRNLFDEDAREPSGGPGPATGGLIAIPNDLPLAGRSYFAEIRYHF